MSDDTARLSEAETQAVIDGIWERMRQAFNEPVATRKVTPKGLPVIQPYEVSISRRTNTDRQNRTRSVTVRFGAEVAPLLRGFAVIQMLPEEDGGILIRGLVTRDEDTSDTQRHKVPELKPRNMATVEGYEKWVEVLDANGWRPGETRVYYPLRAARVIALRPISDFDNPTGPQMVLHV